MNIKATLKLILPAGKVNAGPPVGTILGQYGLNLKEFCLLYNQQTLPNLGQNLQVVVVIYTNKSYKFLVKTESTASLLLSAACAKKGAAKGKKDYLQRISFAQLKSIALSKQADFNTSNMDAICKSLVGTANQMGIEVLD
jgi:large subunit ribosomal protein L11